MNNRGGKDMKFEFAERMSKLSASEIREILKVTQRRCV